MNCTEWEREIARESESVDLEEHLLVCAQCRDFAGELERNRAALQAVEIHPAAFDAVRLRVLGEIRAKKQRGAWWVGSAVAAAACVAMLCALVVLQSWKNPAPPKPLIAAKNPPKIEWTPAPVQPSALSVLQVDVALSGKVAGAATDQNGFQLDGGNNSGHHHFGPVSASRGPAHNSEPLVVKMLTNDPNVIIIWFVDQKGDSL